MEKFFKLKENGTTVGREIVAGLTTFFAMAYIIVVNPNTLSGRAGGLEEELMPWGAVFLATIIASIIGTLVMGLVANVPYAQAPGMGLNAFFVYTVCLGLGFTWQQTLSMVFICGLINILITVTKLRKFIIKSIPRSLQNAIGGGIGIFVAYIGFLNVGFVNFGSGVPAMATLNTNVLWLFVIGLVLTIVLLVCNVKGAILIGIVGSYIVALLMGEVNFDAIRQADWFGLAIHTGSMAKFSVSACITIAPIALATMMEHIGDIAAISATCERPYLSDPGLHRTLLGDGLATSLAGFFGAPANTTYGENTGVLALTKVYDPRVMRIAACFAILLSFFPKIGAAIQTVPSAIIGGISFVLYGMISSVGVRNVVENQVDFTKSRNLIIAAVILVSALGFNSVGGITVPLGASYSFTLSGLAIAAIVGILLNAILPGNDYEFGTDLKGDTAVNFEV